MRKAQKAHGGVLELRWEGKNLDAMSADITAEFDRYKRHVSTVSLSLHSCGGNLHYAQRTIDVLEQIRATHEVATWHTAYRGIASGTAFPAMPLQTPQTCCSYLPPRNTTFNLSRRGLGLRESRFLAGAAH